MLSNSQIKHIVSLKQKKFRTEHQQFVVEGVKLVNELLASDLEVVGVYTTDNSVINSDATVISEQQLKKISNLETPNKVLAVAKIPKHDFSIAETQNKLMLALDNISDPGNLGTIIRTAAWFGIDTVICSQNTVDAWNPKVVQATMGALFRTNVIYTDLEKVVAELRQNNIPVYSTALDGENIYETTLTANGLIIIGNESHGVAENLLQLASKKLHIPSFSKGVAESLNAAVAAGVVCSEFKRNLV